jgi:hypothetical protein
MPHRKLVDAKSLEDISSGRRHAFTRDLIIRRNSPTFKTIHPSKLFRKAEDSKIHFILTLFLLISLLMGCIHAPAPYRPSNWEKATIDMKSVADPPGQPLLQVIIVYERWWSCHTALRLVYPGQPVLFWDPGGGYGVDPPADVKRSKDLIRINTPDLETYLEYVWQFSGVEVEVFEWDLKPEDVAELYGVLLTGTDKNHPEGRFTTKSWEFFCAVAVSDFLNRFAGKTLTVPKSFFLPEHLARVLYTQSPKRVLALRRGKQIVYVPPRTLPVPPIYHLSPSNPAKISPESP